MIDDPVVSLSYYIHHPSPPREPGLQGDVYGVAKVRNLNQIMCRLSLLPSFGAMSLESTLDDAR